MKLEELKRGHCFLVTEYDSNPFEVAVIKNSPTERKLLIMTYLFRIGKRAVLPRKMVISYDSRLLKHFNLLNN